MDGWGGIYAMTTLFVNDFAGFIDPPPPFDVKGYFIAVKSIYVPGCTKWGKLTQGTVQHILHPFQQFSADKTRFILQSQTKV